MTNSGDLQCLHRVHLFYLLITLEDIWRYSLPTTEMVPCCYGTEGLHHPEMSDLVGEFRRVAASGKREVCVVYRSFFLVLPHSDF